MRYGGREDQIIAQYPNLEKNRAPPRVARSQTGAQMLGMLRLTAARRPATLGQAVGRRTVADDGSGAGLDGRHTGKYRRAYEFMVSSRQASSDASSLVRQRQAKRPCGRSFDCACGWPAGQPLWSHGVLLMLGIPCWWLRKNTRTKCAK